MSLFSHFCRKRAVGLSVLMRRILNGIFFKLRTGIPWRDLPERYGPYTTVYNRFNRWTKAGIWDRLMDAICDYYNHNLVMVDGTSTHHSAATQ